MNSFTMWAIGTLGRNPEMLVREGGVYTRFCLVGTDYAAPGEKQGPRHITTTLWFQAFGKDGEAIVRRARKGDQLIVEARVSAHGCAGKPHEDKRHGYEFIVTGVRFGARGRDGSPAQARKAEPPALQQGATAVLEQVAAE